MESHAFPLAYPLAMEATVESAIERVVQRYHREQQGHTPEICSVTLLDGMAVVRCTNVFTPTERELASTEEGRKIVQSARREQRALTRRDVESAVASATRRKVARSFYDLDVRVGEQVEVYVFE